MLNVNNPSITGLVNQEAVNSFKPQQEQGNPWSGMLQQVTPGSTFSARGGFKLPGSEQKTDLAGVTQNIQGMNDGDVNMNRQDMGYDQYARWQNSPNNPAGPNYKANAWNSLATQSNMPSDPQDGNMFGSLAGLLGKQGGGVFSSSPFGI